MEFGVWGLGLSFFGLWFGVKGLESGVWGLGTAPVGSDAAETEQGAW